MYFVRFNLLTLDSLRAPNNIISGPDNPLLLTRRVMPSLESRRVVSSQASLRQPCCRRRGASLRPRIASPVSSLPSLALHCLSHCVVASRCHVTLSRCRVTLLRRVVASRRICCCRRAAVMSHVMSSRRVFVCRVIALQRMPSLLCRHRLASSRCLICAVVVMQVSRCVVMLLRHVVTPHHRAIVVMQVLHRVVAPRQKRKLRVLGSPR